MSTPTPAYADFRSLRFAAGGHPLTRRFSQRAGALLAWAGGRLGLSPSAITVLGLTTFVGAAYLFAVLPAGTGPALACVALFQFGYALDCGDGQLARATGRTSAFGAWLDLACDYLRNIALAGATLYWLARSGVTLEVALGGCGLLLAGTVVHLHTVTTLRQSGARPSPPSPGPGGAARTAATALIDTATVLLCIGLLRLAPTLLLAYVALLGVAYGAMTVAVIRRHLSPGQS